MGLCAGLGLFPILIVVAVVGGVAYAALKK